MAMASGKIAEVSVDDGGLRIDEAGVEVALEDGKDALDFGDGGGGVADGVCRSVAASSGDDGSAIQAVVPVASNVSRNFLRRIRLSFG